MAERAPELAVRVLRPPTQVLARLAYRLEVTGKEHIPPTGPVVLAANHLSFVDPVLVTLVAGRNIRYLALEQLFGRVGAFDRIMGFFGAIPTPRRGVPLRALRTALAHLEGGGALGVFPEGRRVEHWGAETPKRGAAWLAYRTGAPLVPLAIDGAQETMSVHRPGFHLPDIRIAIGPALDWRDYADRDDPLAAMMGDWYDFVDANLTSARSSPSGETV